MSDVQNRYYAHELTRLTVAPCMRLSCFKDVERFRRVDEQAEQNEDGNADVDGDRVHGRRPHVEVLEDDPRLQSLRDGCRRSAGPARISTPIVGRRRSAFTAVFAATSQGSSVDDRPTAVAAAVDTAELLHVCGT